MLATKDLFFQYANSSFQLQIQDLALQSGQSLAIIGASGCGKSTLLSLLSGLELSYSGSVMIDNQPLHALSTTENRVLRLNQMGYVFQEFSMVEYLSIYDNIIHPYRINIALQFSTTVQQRARQLAQEYTISHCLSSFGHAISKGEAQRAAICRALIHQPKLVFADEPSSHLDPLNAKKVFSQLTRYCRQQDAILVVATHDYTYLEQFDHVVQLRGGSHD